MLRTSGPSSEWPSLGRSQGAPMAFSSVSSLAFLPVSWNRISFFLCCECWVILVLRNRSFVNVFVSSERLVLCFVLEASQDVCWPLPVISRCIEWRVLCPRVELSVGWWLGPCLVGHFGVSICRSFSLDLSKAPKKWPRLLTGKCLHPPVLEESLHSVSRQMI